jgi:hypothetical protein
MLSDRFCQLLTAFVDGELSSRQRRHVARLLSRSPEARQLLKQLQADAHLLRRLPQPPLPTDLTEPVLRTIAERRLTPGQRRIAKSSSATQWLRPIASWAVAAAILLILGAASYLYFAASLTKPATTELAQKKPEPGKPAPQPELLGPPIVENDAPPIALHEHPVSKNDPPSAVKMPEVVKRRDERPTPNVPATPQTPAKEEAALTNRLEMFQLESVPDILPVVIKVSDLDREPTRKQLIAELQKDSDFRMELPCQNGTKAFDSVQKAARTLHFTLILEKQAQERIKLKRRTNYVLYLENVTPTELTRFVHQIGAEDRKSAAGKPAEIRIDRLVLTRMTAQHRKELSTLLGIDPTTSHPRATGPLVADSRKPLSDPIEKEAKQGSAGKGGTPRSETAKPTAKAPEHLVLVLPYNPVRPSPGSDEIKRFLEERKPARTGTIRVLIVLRG